MNSLETVLDDVRAAVRRADFVRLGQLGPQLEVAMAQLADTVPRQVLLRLKIKAEENAALLDAARRGARAARRRVEEARRAAHGLQTYDNKGKRADFAAISSPAGRF